MRRLALATLIVCIGAAPAFAFLASNKLRVKAGENGQIIVPYQADSGEQDVWCAVGDYIVNYAGLPQNTVVYRVTPPPIHVGKAVVFSLDARQATRSTGLGGTVRNGGIVASVAQGFCIESMQRRHS